jgi:Cdc6-like AAA superfamily ATPase
MPTKINNALMRLSKRAETQDKKRLVDTFVDNGPLFTLLSREDHQVIYGRRGTGKTHALSYLAESEDGKDVFVDVPPDDYRAIRLAILDLTEFEKSLSAK